MRAFFLTYAYEPGLVGDMGGFRKLWEVAWALQALGHEVQVFYPAFPGVAPLRDVPSRTYPVLDHPVLRPLSAYLSMVGSALRAGRRLRPDVVYFRTGLNVLPTWLGRALGARVVLEVNADAADFLRTEGARRWHQYLFVAAELLNARRSDLVIALTPGLKQMLIRRYGIPEGKVQVIPSGTDPDHFTPGDRRAAKLGLGLGPEQTVVGFVGLFYRHQGVHTLIQAAREILREAPATRFLFVGDGVMRPRWEALARELGLGAAVRFTGQIPYRELPRFLRAMDVMVAPFTRDRGEASPFKILDGLAAGLPVVASDLASIRRLGAGFDGALTLAPPDDAAGLARAVLPLLRDPARRQALGARGRAGVLRHYGWAVLARDLDAALRTVPARESPGRRLSQRLASRSRLGPASRVVASWAPALGLLPRPDHPPGVSAVVRVKDEEEWLGLSIRSLRDVADEIVVGDNGSTDRSAAILEALRAELGERLRVVRRPDLDIKDLTNFLIERTRFRWVLRWDADFVAQTDGPQAMCQVREWLGALNPRQYFHAYLRMIEVCGDLRHQRLATATRADCHCWTASDALRYVYDRAGYEAPKVPRWYRVVRFETPTFFHVDVKSSRRMFLSWLWKRYLTHPARGRYAGFAAYVESELVAHWGAQAIEAAARAWTTSAFRDLVPYDRERFGDYPGLLRPYLEKPGYRLVYQDGQIIGRSEP